LPLTAALVLPKGGLRKGKEGRPFKSKIDLALETIEAFEPVPNTCTHLLVDSGYHSNKLRKLTRKKGYDLSGALRSNRRIRRTIVGPDGQSQREWQSLKEYAISLNEADWQLLQWPTRRGSEAIYAHTLRTQVSKLGVTRVVLTRPSLDGPVCQVRYWGSTLLDAERQTIWDCRAKRWAIEVFFEDAKDLLGSDHYQVMRAEAVERLWALIALLGSFLDEQRPILAQKRPAQAQSFW
jgi:hypothetical protein